MAEKRTSPGLQEIFFTRQIVKKKRQPVLGEKRRAEKKLLQRKFLKISLVFSLTEDELPRNK